MSKKSIYKLVLYVSLIFVFIELYIKGYFVIPEIKDYFLFIISVFFIALGFVMQSYNWTMVLKDHRVKILFKDGLISNCQSVFMKYLPGKVMIIMGRAMYIADKGNVSISKVSSLSLYSQLLSLFSGGLFGLILLFNDDVEISYKFLILLVEVFLIVFFLSFNFFRKLFFVIGKIFKKRIIFPKISLLSTVKFIPFYILMWFFWGLSFYFLSASIYSESNIVLSFIFPLCSVLGIAAIFAPGGIGVREGALSFLMILFGVPIKIAISISVFSRLWYLLGESIIFLLSIIVKKNTKS